MHVSLIDLFVSPIFRHELRVYTNRTMGNENLHFILPHRVVIIGRTNLYVYPRSVFIVMDRSGMTRVSSLNMSIIDIAMGINAQIHSKDQYRK